MNKLYNLNDLIEIISGGTPKTKIKRYWNGDIPWISIKDFNKNSKYIISTERYITEEGLKESSTNLLRKGDIIISARGTVGEVNMIRFPMAFNQSCYGIRAKQNINSHYLYYSIKNSINSIKLLTHGSVFNTITKDTFKKIYIPIFNLDIQQKISHILSSLDEKIEINRKINENLEEQAKIIFKRWFIDYEFPNEEGKPYKSSGGEMVESEMGLIPKGWEIRKVSEIIRFIKGKKPKIISDKYFYGSQKYLTIEVLNGITNLYCTGNNIINSSELDNLIVADGAKSGTIYYAQDGIVGSTLFKMELICEYISNDYIYFLFKLYENEIKLNKTGSAIPHLDRKYVENILITIPGIEFGNKNIFNFLNYIRLLVIRNSEQIQKLTQIRDTLLPKLMTGEIDVSNIDI